MSLLIDATILVDFFHFIRMMFNLRNAVVQLGRAPIGGVILMVGIYLGMIVEAPAIVPLTVPVFFPVILGLGVLIALTVISLWRSGTMRLS